MVSCKQLLDQFLDMRAELFGLLFTVADLEARHAELVLGVVTIEGGELSNGRQPAVGRQGLAVFVKDLHHLLAQAHPHTLADIDKGDRVEVCLC